MNTPALTTVAAEIAALHRIAQNEEFGENYQLGESRVGDYCAISNPEPGLLRAELDFYSQGLDDSTEWNVDDWDLQKLYVEVLAIPAGKVRSDFYQLHRVCRALLAGRTVQLSHGKLISRESHLRSLAEEIDASVEVAQ